MTEAIKRVRTPSDPVATTVALLKRMSPDQLDAVGLALREVAPKSSRLLWGALDPESTMEPR